MGKTIAVDFDGVLHRYAGWCGADHFNEPYSKAKDFLKKLNEQGYEVVIFTSRVPDLVHGWLRNYKMLSLVQGVTNVKVPAIAYIDDRAIRFNGDFDQTLEDIALAPWWKEKEGD